MAPSKRTPIRFLASFALLAVLASSVLTAARPGAHAQQPVTLNVWWLNWGALNDNRLIKMTDSHSLFHKAHPDITVKWTFVPGASLPQKLLTSVAASTPPDMTYVNSVNSQAWAEKGVLTPLDSYFKATGLKKSDFVTAAFPPYEYNGHLYGLLHSFDFMALLWNKDLFKAAGLPNHAPRTIQELAADNAKLFKIQNGRIVRAGFFPDTVGVFDQGQALLTWGLQFGGQFVDRVHHKITANDPHIVQALQWMLDQSKTWGQTREDRFLGSVGYPGSGTPTDPFYTGQAAMEWNGDWDYYTEQLYAPKLHVGVAPVPTAGHGLRLWDNVSWATAIPKGAAHSAQAWTLMRYMTTSPAAAQVSADVVNTLVYKPLMPQFFHDVYRVMSPTNPMREDFHVFQDTIVPHTVVPSIYDIPVATFYDQELTSAVEDVLHGKDTPQHALDLVTQRVQHEWDTFTPGQ